tara:strand:+ start:103 stop:1473 length:1371 start_codon:yes stop_codon:yes gene_type:complete
MKKLNYINSHLPQTPWENPSIAEMRYEIREIVAIAKQLETNGLKVTWENIGDPIHRGHQVPQWIRSILMEALNYNESYAYVPSQGHLKTREYLADRTNQRGGVKITADDILFFNGLGDGISTLYQCLHPKSRVLIPSPVYTTHGAFERFHAPNNSAYTYQLDPLKGWKPDLNDIEHKLSKYPEIIAILLVNPDNPTGTVQDREVMLSLSTIAQKHNVCLIVDEVYAQVVWGKKHSYLSEVCKRVPAISLQGISKDLPWPGARCGWMEFYNRNINPKFDNLVEALIRMKTMEVCSTSLPQLVIPEIMSHENYNGHLLSRTEHLKLRAQQLQQSLNNTAGLIPNRSDGSLFGMLIMDQNCFSKVSLPPIDNKYFCLLEPHLKNASLDRMFTYYLLASTGICTVPLSSFHTHWQGIRLTLLEKDEPSFLWMCKKIQQAYERFYRYNTKAKYSKLESTGK